MGRAMAALKCSLKTLGVAFVIFLILLIIGTIIIFNIDSDSHNIGKMLGTLGVMYVSGLFIIFGGISTILAGLICAATYSK